MRRVRRIRRYSNRRRIYSGRRYGRLYKRYSRKRAGFRRRKTGRTAYQMRRTPAVHLVKAVRGTMTVGASTKTILCSSGSVGAWAIQFSMLPDATSLTDVFKYYRMNKLFIKLIFPLDNTNVNISDVPLPTAPQDLGRIYIVPDPKNTINTSTITEAQLLEMGPDIRRYEVKALPKGILKYKTNLYDLQTGPIVNGSAVGQNFIARKKHWHDIIANNVTYFWGHILHFTDYAITIAQTAHHETKYYFSVRGNK